MESSEGTGQGRRQGPEPQGLLPLQGSGPAAKGAWSPRARGGVCHCEGSTGGRPGRKCRMTARPRKHMCCEGWESGD